jgi:phospholipase D1/2
MADTPILQPGRNCWRSVRADRVAILADTATYFEALADVFERARHQITIVGWDIHSRIELRRRGGERRKLIGLLSQRARARPELCVRILIWDADVIYLAEREKLQKLRFKWRVPANVEFVVDETAPTGTSQHQKIVVVDDAIAFVGGVDLTQRRWDTAEHKPDDPRRRTPNRLRYGPFRDAQAAVDGPAASALAELVRWRWELATAEAIEPAQADRAIWPEWLEPDFERAQVAVSRTLPSWMAAPPIREIEALHHDLFGAAEDLIYIENQYFSSSVVADLLARRLGEVNGPQVVIVLPCESSGWIEQSTMDSLRVAVIERLRSADVHDRLRVVYPSVEGRGEQTMIYVHAKICVVDDRLLRVGSANLTNRSMGVDSECDLVVEADDEPARRQVARIRNRLVGELVGLSADQVEQRLGGEGGLVALIDACRDSPRGLRTLEIEPPSELASEWADESLYDPASPLDATRLADELLPESAGKSRSTYGRFALLLGVLLLAAVLWQWTPLSEVADPRLLAAAIDPITQLWWSVPVALAVFTALSVLVFPTSVLILAMGFVFGAVWGSLYALIGSLLSASISFGIGQKLGADTLNKLASKRVRQVDRWVGERGVWSVMALRLVPLGPFALINMVMGSSRVPRRDFLWGTAIGMAPGIIIKGVFGDQLADFLTSPSLVDLTVLGVILVSFVLVGMSVARWFRKRRAPAAVEGPGTPAPDTSPSAHE